MRRTLLLLMAALLLAPTAGAAPLLCSSAESGNDVMGMECQKGGLGLAGVAGNSLADFSASFVTASQQPEVTSINLYETTLEGKGGWIHYYVCSPVNSQTRTSYALPFNTETAVPEPAAVVGLLTLGLGGLIARSRVFRRG